MTPATQRTHWLIAVLILLLPVAAAAQNEEAPAFGEIVDVRVVNLEVVVTDKGERVRGLDADDFRLLVDGREVPLEYFTEVADGRALASGDGAAAVPALAPGEAVGTRYLVFVDDYFAIPTYRNRVLRSLADQLTLMAPEDRMAIVAFDGREITMLSSWTRSLMQLETALEAAQERRSYGLQRLSEQRRYDATARFDGRFARFASLRDVYDYDAEDRLRSEEIAWQVERVVQGATSALRAFARPPGRKVMLMLSGGWPASPVEWVTGSFASAAIYGDNRRLFDPLIDTANRLGYTLYPIDLNFGNDPLASAEYGTLFEASLASARSFDRDYLEEDSLVHLAAATGGRAYLDGARLGALEDTVEDTRSYYWLGFSPTWEGDDRRHRIEIEMRGKGLKVRTRDSFSDLSRQSEMTMMVESAQLFDLPLPGDSRFAVAFGEPAKAGFKKVAVPVRITIPLDRVTVVPAGGGYAASLELRVAATDATGASSEIPVVPVELRGDQAPGSGGVAVFETELKLRTRPHRLLLSLYDPPSGNLLSKRVEIQL